MGPIVLIIILKDKKKKKRKKKDIKMIYSTPSFKIELSTLATPQSPLSRLSSLKQAGRAWYQYLLGKWILLHSYLTPIRRGNCFFFFFKNKIKNAESSVGGKCFPQKFSYSFYLSRTLARRPSHSQLKPPASLPLSRR
jgi:hypothetical protein